MIDDVRRFIMANFLLSKGDKVIISLSGGPDSVALLLIMRELMHEFDLRLSAFHLNHLIRGEEAVRDESFCVELCKKTGVELEQRTEDIPLYAKENKMSLEAAGRDRRYSLLDEICKKKGINKAATGHTLNDNVETVFLNIIRGTGLNGLCGIPPKRGNIIRPLLDITKDRLICYLKEKKQEFMDDRTNYDTDFLRNFIRNDIITKIDERTGQNISSNVSRMIRSLMEDNDFIESAAGNAKMRIVSKKDGEIKAKISDLKKENRAVATRLIFNVIKELNTKSPDISGTHIDSVMGLLDKQSGARIDLPAGIAVIKEFDQICFYRRPKETTRKMICPILLCKEGRTYFDGHIFKSNTVLGTDDFNISEGDDPNKVYLEYDKTVKKDIVIRYRDEGDYFTPKGRNVTKKLKKYLIEKKIPARARDALPLVAAGHEIIWIPGYDVSGKYAACDMSTKVVVCEFINSEVAYDK